MIKQLIPSVRIWIVFTILTGFIYPGIVTLLCQWMFPWQANGSLIVAENLVVGSSLIGQQFNRLEYFHPRPSAAGRNGYDGASSGGSNLGPTSRRLIERVAADVEKFRKENPAFHDPIPADMATASGSGLDPHISPASAYAQAARIAAIRQMTTSRVNQIIQQNTEWPSWGFLGDARVNVLQLNLALDRNSRMRGASPVKQ